MYKGTEFKEFDKSLLDRNTLELDETRHFLNPLSVGNRFRKYGDHFTKLKDLNEYELNFIRCRWFISFFLCKKHKEHTEDLACIIFSKYDFKECGDLCYLNIIKENLKEYFNAEF